MNETRQTMEGPEGGETFQATQALFQRWRESRPRGARIPKALWAAAVEMAREVGVAQTVRVLSAMMRKAIGHRAHHPRAWVWL
ncbi:MAG: hypothetical protein M0Z85_02925, partial [Gammaproteobacteria bacterium]|nr:hypothetical protein [Gammaproteobacteria bacterium]